MASITIPSIINENLPETNSEDSYVEYQIERMSHYADLCQDELSRLQTEIEKLREVLRERLLYQDSKMRELRLAQNFIQEAKSIAHMD